MKRLFLPSLLIAALAVPALLVAGCDTMRSDTKMKTVALCTKCGEVKGSEECCQPGAEKCSKCGLDKGSPGCCIIPQGAKEFKLCAACGQVAGSAACCDPNAEKCAKCGLAKGSPGCCKLPGM